jgi:hypothetical protein
MTRRRLSIFGAGLLVLALVVSANAQTSGVISGRAYAIARSIFAGGTNGNCWTKSSSSTYLGTWASCGSGGTIGGSLAAAQIPYGTGSDTVAGSADLTWDGTTLALFNLRPALPASGGLILVNPVNTLTGDLASLGQTIQANQNIDLGGHSLTGPLSSTFTSIDLTSSSGTAARGAVASQSVLYIEDGITTSNLGVTYSVSGINGIVSQFGGTNNTPVAAITGTLGLYNGTSTKFMSAFSAAVDVSDASGFTAVGGFYSQALGGIGVNAYPLWLDEQGVLRARADNTFNSVYQAILAGYNPQVLKYTPGAKAYERWAIQWESNVAVLTTEAGPTQTLTSVTSASTTATATLVGHGYRTGDSVVIAGANQSPYNGTYTVTRVSDDVFTYTFAGSGTTPATGTITVQSGTLRAMKIGDTGVNTTFGGTVQPTGYKSSDGTSGATVTTCTGFKNGLCISGT